MGLTTVQRYCAACDTVLLLLANRICWFSLVLILYLIVMFFFSLSLSLSFNLAVLYACTTFVVNKRIHLSVFETCYHTSLAWVTHTHTHTHTHALPVCCNGQHIRRTYLWTQTAWTHRVMSPLWSCWWQYHQWLIDWWTVTTAHWLTDVQPRRLSHTHQVSPSLMWMWSAFPYLQEHEVHLVKGKIMQVWLRQCYHAYAW